METYTNCAQFNSIKVYGVQILKLWDPTCHTRKVCYYILYVWPLFSSVQTQINLILAMPQAVKMGVNWPGDNEKLTV